MNTLKPFEFGVKSDAPPTEVGSFLRPVLQLPKLRIGKWLLFLIIILVAGFLAYRAWLATMYSGMDRLDLFSNDPMAESSYFPQPDLLPEVPQVTPPMEQEEDPSIALFQLMAAAQSPNAGMSDWIVLNGLRFAEGGDMYYDESQLHSVGALLLQYPNMKVKIGGFVHSSGNAEADLVLSEKMAYNVAYRLLDMGVAAENLFYEGMGAYYPLCPEEDGDEVCRAMNRRVSIQIIEK